MNDLNAPLGMNRQPKRPRTDRDNNAPEKRKFPLLLVSLGAAIIALNIYTFISVRGTDADYVVRLPEPEPIAVATADQNTEEPTGQTPEVSVIYGAPDDAASNQLNAPELPPQADESIEVSPGGPRIITVRDPSAVQIGQPLDKAHLPEQAALENSNFGKLPKRAGDGRRPVDIYARPWSRAGGKRIAIIIGGLGLSQTGTQFALDNLPPEITLAFAPTGNSLDRWMRVARKKGHEILMQVPMEPFNYPQVNPGPNTLRLASSAETNIENLKWAMGKTTNYTGIVNYLGARFISNEPAMEPVLSELGERGLLYFNDGSGGSPANLARNALRANVPYASGNVVIDSSNNASAIRAKLSALEALAKGRGSAIGSGSALELTVKAVAEWANEAKKAGFEIVGVTALATDPERRR